MIGIEPAQTRRVVVDEHKADNDNNEGVVISTMQRARTLLMGDRM
jgi:hypothetical protein